MKKKLVLVLLLSILICSLSLVFTSCDLIDKINGILNKTDSSTSVKEDKQPCVHQYSDETYSYDESNHFYKCTICGETIVGSIQAHTFNDQVITEANCTTDGLKKRTCTVCGYNYQVVIKSSDSHNWDDGVEITPSTCSVKGVKRYTCDKCHATKDEDIDYLPHAFDAEVWQNDENQHWHNCTVCSGKAELTDHVWNIEEITPASCTVDGTSRYTCTVCGYSDVRDVHIADAHDYDYVDTVPATCTSTGTRVYTCKNCTDTYNDVIPKLEHNYQGYVCVYCNRDKGLDYKADFIAHGGSESDLISIDSEEEMVCFIDYLLFTESTAKKYVDINYTTVTKTNLTDFTSNITKQATASSWLIGILSPTVEGKLPYIAYYLKETSELLSNKATKSIGDGYPDTRYDQQESIQLTPYSSSRASDYSSFNYLDRENELSVSSSDQLYWAFEHGYKPITVASSKAETILNLAKQVCIEVIDDSMTDSEKIQAFYNWFVQEIQYDNGAFNKFKNDSSGANLKYRAWYAEGVFIDNCSVCDGMSKALCILAGIEDITCIRITSSDHAWNRVYLDADDDGNKEWVGVDVTWANLLLSSKEVLSIDDLFFTDSYKVENGETAQNYFNANCNATESINMYKLSHYGTSPASESNDYYIESQSELNEVFGYVKSKLSSKTSDYITLDLLVSFVNNTTELTSALSSAISYAHITSNPKISPEVWLEFNGNAGYQIIVLFV